MTPTAPRAATIGEIACRTGTSIHKVEYIVRTRGIAPSGWAGNLRIFAEEDVQRIAAELRVIEARREAWH